MADMNGFARDRCTHRRGVSLSAQWLRAISTVLPVLSLVSACAGGDRQPDHRQPDRPPNVILITVDTLRADHLDAYGYQRETAPGIAAIAKSGVRFANAVSQAPWTMPSMASLLSSLYPSQHGAVDANAALPDAAETLAEYLKAAGYYTVGVTSHLFVDRTHGFEQGFDVFNEDNVLGHDAITSEKLTRTALAQVQDAPEPFFLWVHYFDPHFTYLRHPGVGFADGYTGPLPAKITAESLPGRQISKADLRFIKAVYDEEIRYTDTWVTTLWNRLKSRFGENRSILVLTADHGEYFLDRGRFFHGKDVYHELVHVPLVIAGAIDETLCGTVVDQPVEIRSVPKTVARMVGMPRDGFGGVDLLDVARGGPAGPVFTEGSYAWGTDQRKQAVIDNGWKLIHKVDKDRWELYHLAVDPAEKDDQWNGPGVPGSLVSGLQALLGDFASLPRLQPQRMQVRPVEERETILKRLRSLGYVR